MCIELFDLLYFMFSPCSDLADDCGPVRSCLCPYSCSSSPMLHSDSYFSSMLYSDSFPSSLMLYSDTSSSFSSLPNLLIAPFIAILHWVLVASGRRSSEPGLLSHATTLSLFHLSSVLILCTCSFCFLSPILASQPQRQRLVNIISPKISKHVERLFLSSFLCSFVSLPARVAMFALLIGSK